MGKKKAITPSGSTRRMRPALSPEARENQLVSLAVDLAERPLMEGTASSQVITHYLKLASTKEKLEREKLENENAVLKAKVEVMKSAQRVEELYANALNAMKSYSGNNTGDDTDEEL